MILMLLLFIMILSFNTPGTAGGPGGRDRTLAVKTEKTHKIFLLDIPSSYAKISGETNSQPREFPRVKSRRRRKRKKKKEEEEKSR